MEVKIVGEKPAGVTFNVVFENKSTQVHGKNVAEFKQAISKEFSIPVDHFKLFSI